MGNADFSSRSSKPRLNPLMVVQENGMISHYTLSPMFSAGGDMDVGAGASLYFPAMHERHLYRQLAELRTSVLVKGQLILTPLSIMVDST